MKRPRILVVEDDPNDREIYGKLLWYNGFDVDFAEDGQRAIELARESRPDLVLLDLRIPKIHGLDVCTALRRDRDTASVPVIALSAEDERDWGRPARDAGCVTYLEKPVAPTEVLHTVERFVGKPPPAMPEDAEPAPAPDRRESLERHDGGASEVEFMAATAGPETSGLRG